MILNDFFSEWIKNKGVFFYLSKHDCPFPWLEYAEELDLIYHGNHSGNKMVAPVVDFINTTNLEKEAQIKKLVDIIYSRYRMNWEHLYDSLFLKFNPIENYDRYETETPAETTETHTPTIEKNTAETTTKIAGFDSEDFSDSNQTKTEASNTVTTPGTDSFSVQHERTAHIHGNIGVTTAPQMLFEYHKLCEWNFFDTVMKDLDTVLTLQIY